MNKVRAIPEGFHTLAPHLVVRGGIKAIDFYQKAFGAKLVRKMLMPDSDLVMHAELQIGDSHLFLADEMPWPGVGPRSPQSLGGTSVTIHLWSENADATFEQATKAGAKVTMPLMDAFWGDPLRQACRSVRPRVERGNAPQGLEPGRDRARRSRSDGKHEAVVDSR